MQQKLSHLPVTLTKPNREKKKMKKIGIEYKQRPHFQPDWCSLCLYLLENSNNKKKIPYFFLSVFKLPHIKSGLNIQKISSTQLLFSIKNFHLVTRRFGDIDVQFGKQHQFNLSLILFLLLFGYRKTPTPMIMTNVVFKKNFPHSTLVFQHFSTIYILF